MTIDEMIAVLQAYKEGKTIQFAFKSDGKFAYTIPKGEGEVNWDFKEYNYRIKPEPHYRPFKSAEEVMEAIKEHGDWVKFGTYFDRIVGLAKNSVNTTSANMDYGTALNKYRFLDGTPFGKLEE